MKRRALENNRLREGLLLLPLAAIVAALLLVPLGALLYSSVQGSNGLLADGRAAGATLENYVRFFGSHSSRQALGNSLLVSFGVAAISTLVCLAPAWLLVRHDFRGKNVLRAICTLPMSFSGIIIGFLTVIMLGRIGMIPRAFETLTGRDWLSGLSYSIGGIIIAYLYFEIPRATLTLESAIRKIDPRLELAAASLGAGAWQRLRLVILPLILPALLSTFAVTFSVSLGSFGVVLVLSKRFSLTPLQIFEQVFAFSNYEVAAAMSVVLIAVGLTVHFAVRKLSAYLFAQRV